MIVILNYELNMLQFIELAFYTFVKFDLRRYRETIQPNMIALFAIIH